MKIIGYTCTYNEEEYIPYVMPYIEAFCYDKFIVYDNFSTDKTVELLKEYPFVEVRSYDTGNKFDNDMICKLHTLSFNECKKLSENGELVWFTWTDFDEVLFFNTDEDFRPILEGDYHTRGYNCFFKTMMNLTPPEGKDSFLEDVDCKKMMVHECEGIRVSVWHGGMKPTMIAVNDFSASYFIPGNHYMLAKMEEGKVLKNYDDCCRMYGFHLKYIDKNALRNKWIGYAKKGKMEYLDRANNIDRIFRKVRGTSFQLQDYFLHDYFNSALHAKTIKFDGIMVV